MRPSAGTGPTRSRPKRAHLPPGVGATRCGHRLGGSPRRLRRRLSGSHGSITLYSGQHEQTTQSLVTAFEKSTGINVKVRYDDEDTFTDEIVMEASHPEADVFYTENSPPLEYLQQKGLLAAVDPSTLAKTPAKYDSPQGDWVGISARVSVLIYNPSLISRVATADHGPAARRPQVQRKTCVCGGRDRFPADRHLGRQDLRASEDPRLAARDCSERRQPRLPRQRDHRRRGQPGRRCFRRRQPVLLVPDGERNWERRRSTPRSPILPRTTLVMSWTCRAPQSSSRRRTKLVRRSS